jgi:hypothetical protein
MYAYRLSSHQGLKYLFTLSSVVFEKNMPPQNSPIKHTLIVFQSN